MPQDISNLELPSADQAYALRQEIVQQVFFSKMAEYGIVPNTQPEADAMWRTADQCMQLRQHPSVKQAQDNVNPLFLAEQKLMELSSQYGFQSSVKTAEEAAALNQLTTAYAQNPDVYKAMLSLAHAESAASA